MSNDKPRWFPMTRRPKAYEPIICLGADDKEYRGLCYSAYWGRIIDPVTNRDAEPVIGPIKSWRYPSSEET